MYPWRGTTANEESRRSGNQKESVAAWRRDERAYKYDNGENYWVEEQTMMMMMMMMIRSK